MSRTFVKKGYTLQRPKPRKKDPELELKKLLRREQKERELRERLEEIQITSKVIPLRDMPYSPWNTMDTMLNETSGVGEWKM